MKLIRAFILAIVLLGSLQAAAQSFALKSNAAGWVALVPNVGIDLILTETSSVDISVYQSICDSWIKEGQYTGLQIGYRYWFSHQPMQDFFCGVTMTPALYDMKVCDRKHEGNACPVGLNFGYSWPLGKRWSIEASYGVGAVYYNTRIHWANGTTSRDRNVVIAPTNVGLSVSYILK